jgi:hypothetical protein
MGSFFRVDTSKLMRGAGRLMYAPSSQAKPAKISDVIVTTGGPTQYDAATGWSELGSTNSGIQISVNNTEVAFNIDQVAGDVATSPDVWECTVATQLAEMTLENFVFVWEGVPVTTDLTASERETAFAGATAYTERRLAVMFMKPNGKIQGYFFHRAVRSPQQGTINMQQGGTEMTLAMQFNILADATESDPRAAFFRVREQI